MRAVQSAHVPVVPAASGNDWTHFTLAQWLAWTVAAWDAFGVDAAIPLRVAVQSTSVS